MVHVSGAVIAFSRAGPGHPALRWGSSWCVHAPAPTPPLHTDTAALPVTHPCRLAVMSATLGGGLAQDLQQLMASSSQAAGSQQAADNVPVVISEGRSYPVTTHYLGKPRE